MKRYLQYIKENINWSENDIIDMYQTLTEGGDDTLTYKYLNEGGDPNLILCNGSTLLHRACNIGRKELIIKLIECGADVNIKNEGGVTILPWLLHGGKADSERTIIENVNKCKEILEIILNAGYKINVLEGPEEENRSTLDQMIFSYANPSYRFGSQKPIVIKYYRQIISLLVSKGFKINRIVTGLSKRDEDIRTLINSYNFQDEYLKYDVNNALNLIKFKKDGVNINPRIVKKYNLEDLVAGNSWGLF